MRGRNESVLLLLEMIIHSLLAENKGNYNQQIFTVVHLNTIEKGFIVSIRNNKHGYPATCSILDL